MTIYPPLKEVSIWGWTKPLNSLQDLNSAIAKSGQPFGVDQSGPACEFRADWPCDKTMYQMMGILAHNGIDIPCASGTKVYASTDGIVVEVSNDVSAGLGVVIWDKVQKCKTVCWHNKENLVSLNQEVKRGDVIAYADNTGYSKGNHLHFMLKETDDVGNTINKNNGYFGAIDPIPHIRFEEIMSETLVKARQVCEGYLDPEGQTYWADKDEKTYWIARLQDKIKQLQEVLTELQK